jgi:hypothetical protein
MIQIRRLHTKPLIQEAQTQLADYIQYFRTPKQLKPLVYRAKNASELISRDLWDPVQKKRIVPLPVVQIPAASKLSLIINNASTIDELEAVKKQMILLAYKKIHYTAPAHIVNFLEKSAELNKFPHALTLIYSNDRLERLLNADVLNVILSFLYINPRKSFYNSIEKTKVALHHIHDRNPITHLLRLAIHLKFNRDASSAGLVKKIKNDKPLELPVLDTTKAPGASSYQLNKYRTLYLTLKPIEETVAQSEKYIEYANVVKVKQFVNDFETIEQKLEVPNVFEQVKSKSKFEKPTAAEESAETAEEETK